MYSQCPECHARFRVGAHDLGAAGGTVRCGRCGSAFNALSWLSDTVPPSLAYSVQGSAPDESAVLDTSPGPVTGVEFHFTADDIESVFIEPDAWPDRTGPGAQGIDAADPYVFGTEPPIVVDSESRPFEDITLEGERISVASILGIETDEPTSDEDDPTDEFQVLRDVPDSAYPEEEKEYESLAGMAVGSAAGDADATVVPAQAEGLTAAASPPWDALASERSLAAALEAGPTRARPGRWALAWSIGCLLMAVVLLAQITHQYRQDLVRHPQLGPWLRDVYARIGLPLSPNWDLDAFELRQWGNDGGPDANGHLTVRASLTNRATFAQPRPILRLELDDRFGDSVAVRDFEPAEYLKNPSEASRLLGPGASAEAELVILDPGHDAIGYQLDVCLRESPQLLHCAQGPG